MKKQSLKQPLREQLKKIGGGHLLNEKVDNLSDYWNDIVKDIEGDDIKIGKDKYTADYDYHSGALSWGNEDVIIYMTPGYDGVKYIPVEDGNTGKFYGKLPLKTTGDVKKDTKWYLNTIKRNLPKFLKKIK